jgi:glucose uptake protein GlcU
MLERSNFQSLNSAKRLPPALPLATVDRFRMLEEESQEGQLQGYSFSQCPSNRVRSILGGVLLLNEPFQRKDHREMKFRGRSGL